jgi:hypothetical protein
VYANAWYSKTKFCNNYLIIYRSFWKIKQRKNLLVLFRINWVNFILLILKWRR